ncbi:MAG: formate--tetrahydrofolate ligase [Gemmatimonadales bacterium]|nr:formate--tetrahydrofolate ligase [Gemmatimonadales bacterium]NIN50193.1 formate--tetrahydrofolate ligase [Gemmatimonadales bacterium]NIP07657.1 formate--tetrahydrofolate ligase [Gemmatimonadales bacterium]NIR01809.1 formate--tetrahydrofolate ligase [Gemmatimonadales bacterium]NIS65712.1 formate--tetrahydrofolate ligase [Gemmatimonadales bacterium]
MTTTSVPSDIAIAQAAKLRPIIDVAADLDLGASELILYGEHKAKVRLDRVQDRPRKGCLVLVTAMNPTPAGEGKSTVTVGVTQALRKLGHNAVLCMREPSLGPVFGIKGGAAGGGYAQVVPMEDINLHFTGDFHAITSAHNLLSALLDNHLHQGNGLGIDPRRITWPRTIDMNDRVLRNIAIGLGGVLGGVPREERFVIAPASEIMAIMALARDLDDLEQRLARIVVGMTRDREPVRARELKAQGAMTLLLKDALFPNLVQTLEGGPAFVHCGPFGNIAHGCNSVVATDTALRLADIVITEAGFGADLGAEKFFDIKCRVGEFQPEAAVVVATVRALKLHGGASKKQLSEPNAGAVERGFANLAQHLENIAKFGVPSVVALNRFVSDSDEELQAIKNGCDDVRAKVVLCEVWERGGDGGVQLAEAVLELLKAGGARFRPLYDAGLSIREKIEKIAREIYRADGVTYLPPALRAIDRLEGFGLGDTPVCVAKTQYSFADDASLMGAPRGFTATVRDVYPSAGAGFVVALTGDIMTMPGLGKTPAAERMRVNKDGTIEGLF